MATASKTGMYFAMSKKCTNNLTLINTKGSLENIKLLKDEDVSVGLAQKDALKLMKNLDVIKNFTDHSFSFKGDNRVFYYYDLEGMKEFVHLLIRKSDKNRITFNNLDGFRIAHGPLGSGSYITANNLKDILWADFDYKLRSVEYSSIVDALYLLDNNSIDIIVSVIRKRPSFIKRYIDIDKSNFELKVIEKVKNTKKVLYKTKVALGIDRCLPKSEGGKCYYTEPGSYKIRWKIYDSKGIQWCIPKSMEKEKKYKKEEKFYMGKDYEGDSEKIGKDELKNVHTIPVDDLDMDEGVYSD